MYWWFLYWKTYKWLKDESSPCIKVYSSKSSVSQLGLNWGEGGGFFPLLTWLPTMWEQYRPIYRTWLKICWPLNITPTCKSSSNSCHKLEARNYTGCLYTRLCLYTALTSTSGLRDKPEYRPCARHSRSASVLDFTNTLVAEWKNPHSRIPTFSPNLSWNSEGYYSSKKHSKSPMGFSKSIRS